MNLLSTCMFVFLAGSLCALPPPGPGRTYNLESSYNVNFGADEDGGCKSYEAKIKTAYTEALDLVQASIDSLNDLKQPIPEDKNSPAGNEWRRKANTFFTLFGAKLPGTGWTGSSTIGTPEYAAAQVHYTYSTYLQRHTQFSAHPRKYFWLMCSDSWLTYLGPDALDPTDPAGNRKIRDNAEAVAVAGGNRKRGIYYARSAPSGVQWLWPAGAKPKMKSPLCDSSTKAETTIGDNNPLLLITFCPAQLQETNWRTSGSGVQIQSNDWFGKYESAIAVTWVHELGHLVNQWDDQTAVNAHGMPFAAKGGTLAKVYGWDRSAWLAKKKPDVAIISPENFAMFAGAMFWSDWWWLTGRAQSAAAIAGQG